MFRTSSRSLLLVTLLAASAMPAAARQIESAYSDLNLDACTVLNADDFGASWACPGYKGFPVWVAEGDLRFFLSYGFGAEDEIAAGQTMAPFNYLGPKIEWRLSNETGDWRPFATIVRYYTSLGEGEKEGQVLVVTRLESGATCHVAYIDALANPDANAMAQKAADDLARDFDCADEPEFVGKFEAWEN